MKNMINASCNKCGQITKSLKKELFGWLFLILIVPYLLFFGIAAGSIIYSIVFLCIGLYWIISKPSKKIVCEKCSSESEN
jgi:hypothetical protein